jgi:hypothetical protein
MRIEHCAIEEPPVSRVITESRTTRDAAPKAIAPVLAAASQLIGRVLSDDPAGFLARNRQLPGE